MNQDFLAIGDITTDAFIRLKDAEVHCTVDKEKCQLCMDFATKIPYEFVEVIPAVGNSANAAVAAARLGLKAGLVSHIGDDQNGKDCLARLAKEGVSSERVTAHPEKKTNYHYVLWYGDERTILIKHEKFEYSLPQLDVPPRFIYLSSLGEASADFHDELARYLEANPSVMLAFQPGTFQIKLGYERLKRIYARANVFFCNVQEAQKILGIE
jgi:sugar/nucleoside kinase (ribokinase family)